jgi:hypothetical protein
MAWPCCARPAGLLLAVGCWLDWLLAQSRRAFLCCSSAPAPPAGEALAEDLKMAHGRRTSSIVSTAAQALHRGRRQPPL